VREVTHAVQDERILLAKCYEERHGHFLEDAAIRSVKKTEYGLRVEWINESGHHYIGYWSRNCILKGAITSHVYIDENPPPHVGEEPKRWDFLWWFSEGQFHKYHSRHAGHYGQDQYGHMVFAFSKAEALRRLHEKILSKLSQAGRHACIPKTSKPSSET